LENAGPIFRTPVKSVPRDDHHRAVGVVQQGVGDGPDPHPVLAGSVAVGAGDDQVGVGGGGGEDRGGGAVCDAVAGSDIGVLGVPDVDGGFQGGVEVGGGLGGGVADFGGTLIKTSGDVQASGKSLASHTHGGVQPGSGNTGPPS